MMAAQTRRVLLIRHGMTAGNLQKKYIGITDEPLCKEGVRLLRRKPESAAVGNVYVSPLLRCRQTAKILFPEAKQILISELAEMNFGIFENRAFAGDLEYSREYAQWLDSQCEDPVPKGESRAAFEERCVRGFLAAMDQSFDSADETAVFVVHGGTVMSIMHRFAKPEKPYYQWNPANGCGYAGIWDGTFLTGISEI